VETGLFVAARALAEKGALLRRLAERAKAAGRGTMAERYEHDALVYERRRDLVLRLVTQSTPPANTASRAG
jgi:hypothetical protein